MGHTDDWLALTSEETLEPEVEICDPHHHLWDAGFDPAAKFRTEQVETRYLFHEMLAEVNSGHNVTSTVFIECGSMYRGDGPRHMKPVGETEFVNGIAAMSASGQYGDCRIAAGIVGLADLNLGAGVKGVLEAHIACGAGRFRGIRHATSWDASDEIRNSHTKPTQHMMADATFREGFAQLAPLNMSYEAWCYHPQISEVTNLARAFPETTMILNHFGGPVGTGPYAGKRDEILAQWKLDIAELARCPNVVAKLGGINMKINGYDWDLNDKPPSSKELAAATRVYYDHCIEQFGVERCMFESNFPVDKRTCSYHALWNTFKRIASGCSDSEKAALFHDTATRVYRIEA